MKLLPRPASVSAERRGAALMLSFMVLLVLVLILAQIKYSTATADRVARNEETLVAMDSAIESGMLQVFEDLKSDAASDSAGAAGAAGGDAGGALGGGGGGAGLGGGAQDGAGGGQDSGPTDSKEDAWAKAQRTEIDEIQLRILIQDEDSKFNVLSVLTEDEEESEKAVDRLARVIEWARKGTKEEIDGGTARRMAVAMTEYMRRRRDQVLPKPVLLSDTEGEDDIGLPLSLREFQAIDPEVFTPDLFRDYIDEEGDVVHSLGSFLTVWSSVGTLDDANAEQQQAAGNPGGGEPGDANDNGGDGGADGGSGGDGAGQGGDGQGGQAGDGGGDAAQGGDGAGGGGNGASQGQGGQGQGQAPPGWALNLNTAPGAVLHALMDNRDVPYRFWDDVVLYRNEKDDTVEENEDPPLDEYGREIVVHKFFHSVGDLAQVDGWENLEPIVQGELTGLLKAQSQVFSIFITARKPTGDEQIDPFSRQDDIEREEANWNGLVRTVRIVVWRHTVGEGEVEILPIVRWEVLDYSPFEVRDFPESKGYR